MSDLETRLATLEAELARLKDIRAIEMLMGRYTVNHLPKNMSKTLNFFDLDDPRVSMEVGDRGVYRGRAALETLFQDQYGAAAHKGNLLFAHLTTPMIEIAEDGKSAKGVWRSISSQVVMPKDGKGEGTPIWLFGAYAVDFVKKGGGWKILHFHWYRTVKASHYEGWVRDMSWAFGGPLDGSPDLEPVTYHNPYSADSVQDSVPGCPLPYKTYDGPEWQNTEQSEAWGY